MPLYPFDIESSEPTKAIQLTFYTRLAYVPRRSIGLLRFDFTQFQDGHRLYDIVVRSIPISFKMKI